MGRQTRLRTGLWLLALSIALSSGSKIRAGAGTSWVDRLFSESGHDFGVLPRGSIVHYNFAMKNTSGVPLSIVDVHASCGCTSGRALSETAAPGETAYIEAQMDTTNVVGEKATILYVTVATPNGEQAYASLNVSATILSDLVLNPGTLDFGVVARGQTPTLTLNIDRVNMPAWQIQRMLSACKVINANCNEIVRDSERVGYVLKVTLKSGITAGFIRDEIRFVTNDRETPSFSIPVVGLVRGDLSASPGAVSLGTVDKSQGGQAKYLVRASRPFKVSRIQGDGDGFHLTVDNQESRTIHLLNLKYKPAESNARGELRRGFRITTDLADEVPIDLSATLRVEP